jgi:allantoate deiminase
MSSFEDALSRLLARIDELGTITDTPGTLTRTFLSPANLRAAARVGEWMNAAGMTVSQDPGGTIRGILPQSPITQSPIPNPPIPNPPIPNPPIPLILASHLDTVIDAGKYDGALGVLIAIAALEITGPLPFPVHILGFSDEEGVRFHLTYLGSRACVGQLTQPILDTVDANGISVRSAIAAAAAPKRDTKKAPETPPAQETFHYPPGSARGYVEVHIEQGRVLEEAAEPVSGVSAICGQSRLLLTLRGQADHAGTTPMDLRKDALAGAAECVLAAESLARQEPPLVATVGKLDLHPGASNAIPGEARFTLDFRHPDDPARARLLAGLLATFSTIATTRGLDLSSELVQENNAVPCDSALRAQLLDAVEAIAGTRRELPSGAGHDAVMMATAMPVGMLFVRCRLGLSHHPDEYASPGDIATALKVLVHFLQNTR